MAFRFARTGYLGFLRQTQSINEDGELHDAVFIVGSLDETLLLRGMRWVPFTLLVLCNMRDELIYQRDLESLKLCLLGIFCASIKSSNDCVDEPIGVY